MSDQNTSAQAVGRIPSGLFIVTTGQGEEGTGFLGSLIQQVSLNPMILGIGVGAGRPAAELIEKFGNFAVHVLSKDEKDLMKHFAKGFAPGEKAFKDLEIVKGVKQTPLIKKASVVIECEWTGQKIQPGDQVLYFGKVIGGGMAQKIEPLIHTRADGRKY
jgi:flavin reductase (DIM6/NTAB) family NADH-FMN oxidoreductase RutF